MAIKVNGTTVIDDTKKLVNIQSVTFNDASVLSEAPASIQLAYEGFDSAYELNLIDRIELSDRYAFDKNSLITTTSVFDTTKLVHTLDNPNAYDTSADDRFGISVAISGNYAIVGAYFEDDSDGTSSGKAYMFAMDNMTYLDKAAQLVLE
jgi:hypothetical protein